MQITFQTSKLAKELNDEKLMARNYGPERTKVLKRRLTQLAAATNLDQIEKVPPAHCHELKPPRKGQLAVDLPQGWRLVFVPANEPLPLKDDGGLDWVRVTAINIIEVVNYHD